MRHRSIWSVLMMLLVAGACRSATSEYDTVLDGLNEPRGLSILTNCPLCVAEAGRLAESQGVREGPTAIWPTQGQPVVSIPQGLAS
jgi:hypothetical protein